MNDEQIEKLLRKAPAVKTPAGLREQLQAEVKLPRAQTNTVREFDSRPWLRRWLPAVSFAVFFLGCAVVIGVQTSVLSELKRENAELRGAGQNLDQLKADNADSQRLVAQSQELERLRADNADVERLRGEVAQLKAQVKEAEGLRAENQKLRQENAARLAQNAGGGESMDDLMAKEKAKAERAACMNNLKQIGLGARIWESDRNNGLLPTNFVSMAKELNSPKILVCPGDQSRVAATDWSSFTANNVSYTLVSPGADEREPIVVYAYCPIHHNYLLVDGSVQALSPQGEKAMIHVVDGKTIMGPAPQSK